MGTNRRQIYSTFYRWLLGLYPKPFKERFEESMGQTFDDRCNEQNGPASRLVFFTLRESFDTGLGIVKELVLDLSQRRFMQDKAYSIIGLLLMLPAALLLTGLMFGIEPPITAFLQGPPDGPHIVGSLIALTIIIVLPIVGLLINMLPMRTGLFGWPDLLTAGGIGILFVGPFVILEMTYAQNSDFPVPLFGVLWLIASAFVAILMPLGRSLVVADGPKIAPVTPVLSAVVVVILATMWLGIVIDQMPCFLGVPNCD